MERISEISNKTATMAWEWAEANQGNDKLAEAYVGACVAIGMHDRAAIAKRLGIAEAKVAKIDAHIFEYRNGLAREIVKMLKRNLPNAAVS